MLKKLLLRFFLLTGPALWLTGYGVYKLMEWLRTSRGTNINPLIYELVMVLAVTFVVWLTAGDILRELRKRNPTHNQQTR
jgi:hypothetical protein